MGSKHVNIFAVKCMNNHIKQRNVSNIVCLFKSDRSHAEMIGEMKYVININFFCFFLLFRHMATT